MNKKTKDIDILKEQNRIKDRINAIKGSGIYDKIKNILNNFRKSLKKDEINNVRLEGRIKKEDSASEKIERQGVSADEIYDLIGFMLVVELPEEYKKVSELMQQIMPKNSFIHNFDGKLPENNGYSSFHMGINVAQLLNENGTENTYEDSNQSVEVQLKSYGMYMAQEATHDSIYKNGNLTDEQKNRMQSVMFPLIEKISDTEKYQDRLEICFDEKEREHLQDRIDATKQEILQLKMQHKQFIDKNMPAVENVLKEYVVVKYVDRIKQDPFLNLTKEKISEVTQQCNRAISYLSQDFELERMSNTVPTGFKNTDKLLEETQEKTIEEMQTLSEMSRKESEQQTNTALVEYKPNRLKMFFDNIVNKIKSSNLYKTVMNARANENTDSESIDRATEKIEMEKKNFEDSLIVSKEEQEKNRKEYEQNKQKSAILSVTKGKEQEGDERY